MTRLTTCNTASVLLTLRTKTVAEYSHLKRVALRILKHLPTSWMHFMKETFGQIKAFTCQCPLSYCTHLAVKFDRRWIEHEAWIQHLFACQSLCQSRIHCLTTGYVTQLVILSYLMSPIAMVDVRPSRRWWTLSSYETVAARKTVFLTVW